MIFLSSPERRRHPSHSESLPLSSESYPVVGSPQHYSSPSCRQHHSSPKLPQPGACARSQRRRPSALPSRPPYRRRKPPEGRRYHQAIREAAGAIIALLEATIVPEKAGRAPAVSPSHRSTGGSHHSTAGGHHSAGVSMQSSCDTNCPPLAAALSIRAPHLPRYAACRHPFRRGGQQLALAPIRGERQAAAGHV